MTTVNFEGKIWKTGNSAVLTIPADFITYDQIKVGKEYNVTLEEVKNDEGSN